MASVDQFLDYVLQHATDVPEDIIKFNVQEAVTDFLIDTRIATDFHRFGMSDKVHDYVLDIPECRTILDIKRVIMGNPCDDTVDWIELKRTGTRQRVGYYQDIDNDGEPSIWVGEPCENQQVEVEYVYTVSRGGCEIPDFVYNKYARVIQYSVLSKLYLIPGQEWSNASIASSYLQMYEREIAKIKRSTRKFEQGKLIAKPFIGRGGCCCFGGFFR